MQQAFGLLLQREDVGDDLGEGAELGRLVEVAGEADFVADLGVGLVANADFGLRILDFKPATEPVMFGHALPRFELLLLGDDARCILHAPTDGIDDELEVGGAGLEVEFFEGRLDLF